MTTADLWTHSVAFVAAVVLHTPLLFIAQSRPRPAGSATALIVRLDFDDPEPRALEHAAPNLPRDDGSARAVHRGEDIVQPASLSIEPHLPTIDWAISGAIAAQSAVDSLVRAESYRKLGPRTAPAAEPGASPSVFETPKHRFGDVEPDPLNYDRVWHNERCFTELGKPVTPRADARIGNVNPPKCWFGIGKKKARGDLFDHLKRDRSPRP